jgi:UDP-N-acetylmuramoyl-L-alanyl-D-glutamate--2,6-diaminopimelate ligase
MMAVKQESKSTLAGLLGDLLPAGRVELADVPVVDIASDSRQVTPGTVFFALGGRDNHGLDHVLDAQQRGAAVVVFESDSAGRVAPLVAIPSLRVTDLSAHIGAIASRFFRTENLPAPVIGITGTNGKTTVAWLVSNALRGLGGDCGYMGTLGWGVMPELSAQTLTTPDCITVHRQLATLMAEQGPVVMEVSSHAMDQGRVDGVAFDVAAFTNLSRDHLDYHPNMAAYAEAKARLFESQSLRHAVINIDDAFGVELASRATARGVAVTTVRIGEYDDAQLVAGRLPGARVSLGIRSNDKADVLLASQLVGEFNVENLLVSLAVLEALGIGRDKAVEALSQCAAPPGRMQVFGGDDTPTVVVDFAHTPAALERALTSLRSSVSGQLVCVFGCGGDRDQGKRPLMGAVASAGADQIILTDDNPRDEDAVVIVDAIRDGIDPGRPVTVEHDRGKAIALAVQGARPGDAVLIAGKGHERVQIRAGAEVKFSDQQQVNAALEAWR